MSGPAPDGDAAARERWAVVARLFAEALDAPPEERSVRLEAGSPDADVRDEVRRLLATHDALSSAPANTPHFLGKLDLTSAASLLDHVDGAGVGSYIDRYEVIRQLGRGSTGAVFLARDSTDARVVAVKVLARWLSADPLASRRFLNEALIVSELTDPHIATVYRSGTTDDGQLFIAMAYLDGITLRERLAAGPVPVDDALRIAIDVADGLSAAHARAIVHRDIKPENILLAEHGACIVDFGIAKLDGESLTRPGTAIGTAAYMSPEQARGDPVDRRTDVWSLGVVLYELLSGVRPFEADSAAALLNNIRTASPAPLLSLRPELPERLHVVVRNCLEKDRGQRYPSADALRTALALCRTRR